jgi:hypothetical protein
MLLLVKFALLTIVLTLMGCTPEDACTRGGATCLCGPLDA